MTDRRNTADLVRALYERYQARDWSAAEELLDPGVHLWMLATSEVLSGRDSVLGLQVDYPEPRGELRVLRVVGDGGSGAAVEVEITGLEQVFRCGVLGGSRGTPVPRHGVLGHRRRRGARAAVTAVGIGASKSPRVSA
jgi:hypothetical protein